MADNGPLAPSPSPSRLLALSARMALRDWRSGELRLLAAALVLAVAAVTSVGFFVDRVQDGMRRDAAKYMGGDLALESDRPLDDAWSRRAQELGLSSARSVAFPSMAMSAGSQEATALVAVKAVTAGYPLRGTLRIDAGAGARDAAGVPPRGSAWVDPEVLKALDLALGGQMRLGRLQLRVEATIVEEPDRRAQVLGFAPRVLLNMDDLAASALVQPASRVTYRWTVAGDRAAVAELSAALSARLERGQHLETLEEGRPEIQRTMQRAQRFLGLTALLTVLIAAVAVSSAARRFTARRMDDCALMRCFGLPQNRILALFSLELLGVGALASLAGVAAGLALHQVLVHLLSGLAPPGAPWPGPVPALQGLFCGLVVLLGFGLPPLEQLRRVPALRMLRRELGAPRPRVLLAYLAGAAGFSALLLWAAGDFRLAAIVGAGFLACVGAFAALAWAGLRALQLLRKLPRGLSPSWRHAIAALRRRPGASVAQVVALSIGLMALLLLAIVRGDLVDQWHGQAPPQAPNRFIINIQPEQTAQVAARLAADGIAGAGLEPMVRGRLVQIDDRPIGPESYADERARGLVDREFNLSYRAQAPAHNRIVQGRWFAPGAPELSIEEGIAQRLGIGLGQLLQFDVAGRKVEARVSSVRKLDWESMRVNFFVIMEPELLRDMPQTYITSFYLPPAGPAASRDVVAELVREFPNLTVIDTGAVLAQVRGTLDQLIHAVQFLFAFALAGGVLVLYTALIASQEERMRETALLRALGASRRRLEGAQRAEMILVGALAGALAAAGAAAIAWALARFAFEFDFRAPAWLLPAGLACGAAASIAGGWAGLRRILLVPPLQSLRDL